MTEVSKLILCSGSPRRSELMSQMGLSFEVDKKTDYVEDMPALMARLGDPQKVCAELSLGKSLGFHRPLEEDEIIITADTLVSLEGRIMGKPASEEDAFDMIHALAGHTHCVTTALTVRSLEKTVSKVSNAYVEVSPMTDEEIWHYIREYRPLDKAGAYGIQEWIGLVAIPSISGSFYTIMGLDTAALYSVLKEF